MSDERIKKSSGGNRVNRAMQDRPVTSNREVSEDERVEMFRQQFFQSSLPDLPEIPGWHLCWLTTTNPRDSIQQRIRLGYEPVKSEEKFMMEAHHNAPAREEEKLSDTADFMEQQAKASGSRIDMGDGTREIGEHREGRFDLA